MAYRTVRRRKQRQGNEAGYAECPCHGRKAHAADEPGGVGKKGHQKKRQHTDKTGGKEGGSDQNHPVGVVGEGKENLPHGGMASSGKIQIQTVMAHQQQMVRNSMIR